jgi:Leucine Rich repeat
MSLVCAASRLSFVKAFVEAIQSHFDPLTKKCIKPFPPLKRLSLHACQTLPPHVYPPLLSQLPGLTHLDLSSTQVKSYGLLSIHPSARLRHLYLGNCGNISGSAMLMFLIEHSASQNIESLNVRVSDELSHPIEAREVPLFLAALKAKGTLKMLDVCGIPITDEYASEFPTTLRELGIGRNLITSKGIKTILKNVPELFYLDLEAELSGRKLRLGQYADVFTSIRQSHPNVCIVECSGPGVEVTDEIENILYGWHWVHGRSRRGWLVSNVEYGRLRQKAASQSLREANPLVKIGWKANKLNCCKGRTIVNVLSLFVDI